MCKDTFHSTTTKIKKNEQKKVKLNAMDNLLEQEARLNESVLKEEDTIKLSQTGRINRYLGRMDLCKQTLDG